jgi:hypothetical protein
MSRDLLHHPANIPLLVRRSASGLVVGAAEGEEGIGAVGAVVVAGRSFQTAVVVVPLVAKVARRFYSTIFQYESLRITLPSRNV